MTVKIVSVTRSMYPSTSANISPKNPPATIGPLMPITLREIDVLAKKLNKTEIDLSELGYDKVLSTGNLTQALTIKAKKIVEKAKQKIENVGGKAIENV